MRKNVIILFILACFFTVLMQPRPVMGAADPMTKALERYAESRLQDSTALDTIFKHLDITTKADEAEFLEKIANVAKKYDRSPLPFENAVRQALDVRRFNTVDVLLKEVYREFGKELDVVVRTGSSGIRYLELAKVRHGHQGYRLLFSDDDISFVGKKAVQAAKRFNELLAEKGLERLKVKGFDIVSLERVRGLDLHMLNLLEGEKFVGEAAMSGIKKEMLIKGAVIAENRGGHLVFHAEPLEAYVKNKISSILADELEAKALREAVRKYGALTMVGSCERQITKAHGGWHNLSDSEKVKYVLREREALAESGALEKIEGLEGRNIKAQIERLKAMKKSGDLTKEEARWLRRIRTRNVMLAFEEIPIKLNPIVEKARVSGWSLAGNPEVRKVLDELTVGFVLMREHVFDVGEKEILAKLSEMAGKNEGLYKILYTSFQRGKELNAALDAWLKAGLSREAFVDLLLEVEGHLARLELIKARMEAAKKGSAEVKTLREVEVTVSRKEGNVFLTRLLKKSAGKKIFIAMLGAAGGAFLLKEMHNAWASGKNQWDMSDAAFTLIDFVPGGMSFKRALVEGIDAQTTFGFVKEALYFSPAWPLVLVGDVAMVSVEIGSSLRVQSNQNGLIDLLVYAGEYSDNGRFVRLKLPKAAANRRRVVEKGDLADFFFKTKTVVVPVSGMKKTYRISDLSKVSSEILDQVFLENDPVTQQLRKAAQQQLRDISHAESWARIEKGAWFSGVFEYAKWMTGFSTICEKSPEKWCGVFNLLKKKIKKRHEFVRDKIMIPLLIREAEKKHTAWAMGNKPPVEKLAEIQKKIEDLRGKPLEINLVKEVGKRADAAVAKAAKDDETREKQKLARGKYWHSALLAYDEIYQQSKKLIKKIARKLNLPTETIRTRILRFPWAGDYKKDEEAARASLTGFALGERAAWNDVRRIKKGVPDPDSEEVDRQALEILAKVQFRWRRGMDAAGHPEKAVTTSSKFKEEYRLALEKVEALYGKTVDFQALVERNARIVHGPLHLGKQVSFTVKIAGKRLKEMLAKDRLRVTWHSKHGDFGSNGKGLRVNFATRRLLPVTVKAVLQDKLHPMLKGILNVTVPVIVPQGTFRLTLKPAQPKPGAFMRAEVAMPDRYLNAYKFHYTWRGKGCRVEGEDRFFVVVTAPKAGKASVGVEVSAEDGKGKRVPLGSDRISFNVVSSKKKKVEKDKDKQKGENKPAKVAKESPGQETEGTEAGTGTAAGKPGHPPKRKVKHGAGGSASGMYPAKTFNGMQISYSVSGASMPKMEDREGFTCTRHYEGRLGSGTLTLSGTARVTWKPLIVLSVSVSAGREHAEKTYKFEGPGSRSFSLSIPIPEDATGGGFSISMSGAYGNGEVRGLSVSGAFSEDGPEGKAPKGTEDLKVELSDPKNPVVAGEKVTLTAKVRGGRFPYKFTWSGAKGAKDSSVFQSPIPGPHTVRVTVTDVDGNTASGHAKVVVQAPEFEVIGLPSRPIYASTARLRVRVKGGGKGKFKPVWQASEPGIAFDPPEGMETTVTFGRVKDIAIWVQVPQPNGGKTLESEQVHVTVVGPKFTLTLKPKDPYVGQEIRAKIKSSAKLPLDTVRWVWTSPPPSNRMEYNDPASEIGFVINDAEPYPLQAEARVPHYGDVIGKIDGKAQAKQYGVTVVVLGLSGPKPRIWKEGKGLVEVERQIAVHQNVRLTAKITPVPKNTPLRYEWTLNEDSHFASLSSVRDVLVNRSRTGACVAKVTVKNKYGVILGKGKGSFSVSISQEEINSGKQKAEDRKRAKQLVKKARDQWLEGRVEEAIATLEKAVQLDPGNTKAKETLEIWKEKAKDFALAEKYKKDGTLLEVAGELADAVAAYKKSLAIRPDKSLEAHVKALERKIAEQKKPIRVADAGAEKGGAKGSKGEKPLGMDDLFGDDKKGKGASKKPLSVDDILDSGKGKKGGKSGTKGSSARGKKPLNIDDIFGGGGKPPASQPSSKPGRKVLEQHRDRLIQEGYRTEKAIRKYTEAQKIHRDAKVDAHIQRLKAEIREFDRLIHQGYGYEKSGNVSKAIACYKKALRIRYDARVASHIRSLQQKNASGSKPRFYVSFAGKWHSDWGSMTFTQKGNVFYGTYTHDKGRIKGVVRGRTMYGVWTEVPTRKPPRDAGDMQLTLSRDGKTFTGTWRYGFDTKGSKGWDGTWHGTKIADSPPSSVKNGGAKQKSSGKSTASSTYTTNTKGNVFKGGHWAGSRGGSDWLQKDFGRVVPISKIYIKEASTDVTTRGFCLILKLQRPDGSWVVIDELRNTNINRSRLSNGRIGHSIPPYTKKISPPVPAKAFRLEFYGHGWFDASDIRIYTPRRKSGRIASRGKSPWTGTYRLDLNDREGTMSVVLKLVQSGNRLKGTIRAKAVSSKRRDLNFDFKKSVTGSCSGNRGTLKLEEQPPDKVRLLENGRKLVMYDAEDNKKYVLRRVK